MACSVKRVKGGGTRGTRQTVVTCLAGVKTTMGRGSRVNCIIATCFSSFGDPYAAVYSPLSASAVVNKIICHGPKFNGIVRGESAFSLHRASSGGSFSYLGACVACRLAHFSGIRFSHFIYEGLNGNFVRSRVGAKGRHL